MSAEMTAGSGSVPPPGFSVAGVDVPAAPRFAAGWYDVEDRPNTKGYWDGEKWTGDYAPTQPSVGETFPAGWYNVNDRANTKRYWDGDKWTDDFAPIDPNLTPGQEGADGGGLTAVSVVLALASLGFFPIILGPIAIVSAVAAIGRKERNGGIALVLAIVGMVAGALLGAYAWKHNGA